MANVNTRLLIVLDTGLNIFIVRLKFQKRSELKFVSRTIPRSGGYEL